MTPEEIDVLKQIGDLLELRGHQITALTAALGGVVGLLRAKEVIDDGETESMFEFIEQSLPDASAAVGWDVVQTLRTTVELVLKAVQKD